MDGMSLPRDAITYSSVISALAKGKQWAHALQARPPPLPYNRGFQNCEQAVGARAAGAAPAAALQPCF